MKRIILCIPAEISQAIANYLTDKGYEIVRNLPHISKSSIADFIQVKPDVIFISEHVAVDKGLNLLQVLQQLKTKMQAQIIVHTNDRQVGDKLLQNLVSINIYDLISTRKFSLDEIDELIKHPKSFSDVSRFYNPALDESDSPLSLERSPGVAEVESVGEPESEPVPPHEADKPVKEKKPRKPLFPVFPARQESKEEDVISRPVEPKIIKQTVEKVVKVEVATDLTIVAFSGAATGKSFVTWNLAHLFAQRDYNTSVINVDHGYSANVFYGIESDEAALKDLVLKVRQIYQDRNVVKENLSVFTHGLLEAEEIQPDIFLQAINYIRVNSAITIVDCRSGYSELLEKTLAHSAINLFVFDLDFMHTQFNLHLYDRLQDFINPEKTIVIINNTFDQCQEIEHVRKIIKNMKQPFKGVIEIHNGGAAAYDAMHTDDSPYDITDDERFKADFDQLMDLLSARKPKSSLLRKIFSK